MDKDLERAQLAVDTFLDTAAASAKLKAEAYRQRFQFSLALGNAAGVIYALTMMTSERPILPWWHVLPSAWLFVIGATLGSAMLWATSKAEHSRWTNLSGAIFADHASTVDEANKRLNRGDGKSRAAEAVRIQNAAGRAGKTLTNIARTLELVAATAFVAGVVYPLVILTARAWA